MADRTPFMMSRRVRSGIFFALGIMLGVIFAAVAVSTVPGVPQRPIIIFSDIQFDEEPVCPGDIFKFSMMVAVQEPGVFEIAIGFNEWDGENIGNISQSFRIVHATSRTFRDTDNKVIIPNVSPGAYEVALGAATNRNTLPATFRIPVHVIEDCD